MIANGKRDDTLRDYLLGGLTEEAKEELERQLMTEDGDFQELLIQEEELVDEYVSGELSEEDRARFENHFLGTPERRRKLRFSATLRAYLQRHWQGAGGRKDASPKRGVLRSLLDWFFKLVPHPTPAWGAAAAALLLALSTGVWSTVGYVQVQEEIHQVSAERGALLEERENLQQQVAAERARAEQAEEKMAAQTPPSPSAGVERISFTLTSGLFRGAGEVARIRVPSAPSLVALQLDIGLDEYARYRAALYEVEGDEVWTQAKLKARTEPTGAMVVLTLPSELLAPGDYYVKLDGILDADTTEGLGRYDFRVTRE